MSKLKVLKNIDDFVAYRKSLSSSVGFVPTMGNLHDGHLALVKKAKKENTTLIVSIFVNPTQFNQEGDFINYPKTLDADLEKLAHAGVDACFLPTKAMMYPDDYQIQVCENTLSTFMEGKHRPGHFTGVLTIVLKLLNLVMANNAYFGEKDYQQYLLIDKMTKALFLQTKIHPCQTIREKGSALALSSRNNRLSEKQKSLAVKIANLFHQPSLAINELAMLLNDEPIKLDYLEEHFNRRFIAYYIDDVRLIDNYPI